MLLSSMQRLVIIMQKMPIIHSISAARTFPHGLDNEVFSFAALEMAYKNATKDYEKEHVTPYIYRSNPGAFKIFVVNAPKETL